MDHERFKKEYTAFSDMSLAEALIHTDKVHVAGDLWDFRNGDAEIDFSELSPTELLGDYTDTRGAAIKIFKHITVGKTEDVLDNNGLINALIKARKDTLVNNIF